jgi:diketogulonate reductase-like aldo/keto reductase
MILASILFLTRGFAQLNIPTIEIAPGVNLPLAGLGTWLYDDATAYTAVSNGLKLGATHIDTAFDYSNAKGIGKALAESSRPRDSYFITTKIEGGLNYTTIEEHNANLEGLGIEYADLLLTHFPTTMANPPVGSTAARQEQWRALEDLVLAGKAKAIGVSHYCQRHMMDILNMPNLRIRPAINQVEFHVGMGMAGPEATDYRSWLATQNITYQSFSPLCGPCCMGDSTGTCTYNKELITGELVTSIGAKYNKTGPQVALRWQVQQGIPVIPKSDNPKHILQNMQLFDFELSGEDMARLTSSPTPPVTGGGDGKTSGDCGLP